MVQPPDYYLLMSMQSQPRETRLRHHERPVPPARRSFSSRVRALLARTTLGPVSGDHVLGDGQWLSHPGSYPVR